MACFDVGQGSFDESIYNTCSKDTLSTGPFQLAIRVGSFRLIQMAWLDQKKRRSHPFTTSQAFVLPEPKPFGLFDRHEANMTRPGDPEGR